MLYLVEVVLTFFAEAVRNLRCISHIRLVGIGLAVEDTQRAALKAVFAVIAQIFELIAEEILQNLTVHRTAFRTADGIQGQLEVFESQAAQ